MGKRPINKTNGKRSFSKHLIDVANVSEVNLKPKLTSNFLTIILQSNEPQSKQVHIEFQSEEGGSTKEEKSDNQSHEQYPVVAAHKPTATIEHTTSESKSLQSSADRLIKRFDDKIVGVANDIKLDQSKVVEKNVESEKCSSEFDIDDESDDGSAMELPSTADIHLDNLFADDDTIANKLNFLNNFSDIPNIDDISETVSLASKDVSLFDDEIVNKNAVEDKGHTTKFIDNLVLKSSPASSIFDNEFEIRDNFVKSEEKGSFESLERVSSGISLVSGKFEFDKSEEELERKEDYRFDKLYREMFRLTTTPIGGIAVEKTSEIEDEETELLKIKQNLGIQDFLNKLLDKVVTECETYEEQLRNSLEKKKLMNELIDLVECYNLESNKHQDICEEMIFYYIRKRNYWAITPVKSNEMNRNRYKMALADLDQVLKMQELSLKMRENEINKLVKQKAEAHNKAEQEMQHLGNIIRNTMCVREDFDRIKTVVNELMKRIAKMCDDISHTRIQLILKQHDFADIEMRSNELDNLGDGLKLQEYLSYQTETDILVRKIEERNIDLTRLHNKISTEIHTLAHLKSKEQMLNMNLKHAMQCLDERLGVQRHLRELIHKANLNRAPIRQEINDIKAQCFLLHYPRLMRDYDNTIKELKKRDGKIRSLHTEHDDILNRLESFELEKILRKIKDSKKASAAQSRLQSIYSAKSSLKFRKLSSLKQLTSADNEQRQFPSSNLRKTSKTNLPDNQAILSLGEALTVKSAQ